MADVEVIQPSFLPESKENLGHIWATAQKLTSVFCIRLALLRHLESEEPNAHLMVVHPREPMELAGTVVWKAELGREI